MDDAPDELRTCLHCALVRAIEAESRALQAGDVSVVVGRSDAVWVPISGARVYRGIRRLLRRVTPVAGGRVVRLSVVDLAGKPHVEVMAAALLPARAEVFGVEFPRVVTETLDGGFGEYTRPA